MTNSVPQTIRLQDYQVPDFLINHVDLDIHLDEEFTQVSAILTLQPNPNATTQAKNLVLHGENMELLSVTLNDKVLDKKQYELAQASLTIFNMAQREARLQIITRIKPQENTTLSGLYKSSSNFCTQCEAHGFRRITYFLDRPDVMATYSTTITANEALYPVLLSNGNLVQAEKLADGKHRVRWEDPFKKPSYLFALVAGNLEFIEDHYTTKSGRDVVIRIYVEPGNLDKCTHAMQAVKKSMRWDEENYGREYDLDIYMIVAVSDFNMGAMENKGLNIFNTKYILAKADTATDDDFIHVESVIAHEYFHNWTGNRITCRDWFQLSLKEGLTIFRDQSFTADATSQTVARIHDVNALRLIQFPEDAGPLSHPVRPNAYIEINNFYTSTVYNKGAEVIRMMQTLLGKAMFRRGMDLYFVRHDGQAVTIEDFAKAMEDASSVDLSQFRLWYSQSGTPTLDIYEDYNEKMQSYSLTIKQSCPATPGQSQDEKKPFHIPIEVGLLDQDGKALKIKTPLLQLKQREETFTFDNVTAKPIPSLLRGFSAPVKIKFNYTNHDLLVLFKHDADAFNRWEAGQKLAMGALLQLIKLHQHNQPLLISPEIIDAYCYILSSADKDKRLLAEMLILPTEKYLAEQMAVVDVDAIHAAREFMLRAIAANARELLLQLYQQNHDPSEATIFTMQAAGKRHLKNICLNYLISLNDSKLNEELGMTQFRASLITNMTDTVAALKPLVNINSPLREAALGEFYQQWHREALVVDKWLALQAMSKLTDTLSRVKKLIQHDAFDIKNPNKVYALIGAFGQNAVNFHQASGEGYEFLADVVQTLDSLNPQVAARMIQPLMSWRRYDKKRQVLMRTQLEKISHNKNLSRDVFELVSKSLKMDEVIAQ